MVLSRTISRKKPPPLRTKMPSRGRPSTLKIVQCVVVVSLVLTAVLIFITATTFKYDYDVVVVGGEVFGDNNSPGGFSNNILAAKPEVVFTPQNVLNGRLNDYVSLPVFDDNVTYQLIQERVKRAIARKVDKPLGLMHEGTPPGHDAVMGLASYKDGRDVFRTLVGSLRTSGFDGHIILGVHPSISEDDQAYLAKMDVTFYAIEIVPCDESISDGGNDGVRNTCARGIEYLTLEKARFEMSRQWLHACKSCTGWVLAMDTRDIVFQRPPFAGMPHPDKSPYDLLFIEELAPYTQPPRDNPRTDVTVVGNGWYQGSDGGCYGHHFHEKYPERAILCSGTIIGNRRGMDRFLAVFVDEFLENNKKANPKCKSAETPDQLILQPMYYSGYFGEFERTRTSPWGTGPVNTIGVPCVRSGVHSSLDLTEFDNKTGLILNLNVEDGHPMRIAPIVHQWDRCHDWIHPFFNDHDKDLFGGRHIPLDQLMPVQWIFTPQNVLNGRLNDYVSLPVLDAKVTYQLIQERVKRAIARKVDKPFGLMHEGTPPGHDAVMGLASYKDGRDVFRTLVGSLRTSGFDGHIILGVHPSISDEDQSYLIKMDVTFYAIEMVPCDESISDGGNDGVRNTCARGIEYLTLEKARFEMSRQWLHACKSCTGWALTMDTRDIVFQRPPFTGMPPPDKSPYDLLMIEEYAPHVQPQRDNPRTYVPTVGNGFYSYSACYGHYHRRYPERAILCSGTIIGNRRGMDRFLAVYVDEFLEHNKKDDPICKSAETQDQLVLQHMYYSGYFGEFERTRTSPWGTGPVNTIGVPCVREGNHSSLDLTEFDNKTGLILNLNVEDGHPMRIAPIVHQWDRCHDWIHPFFNDHDKDLFGGRHIPLDQVKPVPWKVETI